MNVSDMHIWFRQYAQQMGMQNVRAILPEQIDILINTSITDTVNQIIRENIGITNDRIITDNSKIGQINALKHLYKVKEVKYQEQSKYFRLVPPFLPGSQTPTTYGATVELGSGKSKSNITKVRLTIDSDSIDIPMDLIKNVSILNKPLNDYIKEEFAKLGHNVQAGTISISDASTNNIYIFMLVYLSDAEDVEEIVINLYDDNTVLKTLDTTYFESHTSEGRYLVMDNAVYSNFEFENKNHYNGLFYFKETLADYLFLVHFSIDYVDAATGLGTTIEYLNNFKSNLFPIRLIDDAYLADTLNDFILRPRLRSPIAIIVNNNLQIYLGKLNGNETTGYFLDNNLVPNIIRISYIAKPAIVKYSEDINGQNVDCDLPDYMHVDILKHAVDMYRAAVGGGIAASQANEQAQQREDVRNNYRNEGYQ